MENQVFLDAIALLQVYIGYNVITVPFYFREVDL